MIAIILAAASILGARPLNAADPARQAMVIQSQGHVIVRLDASGYVQARGCDGRMRHVGDITPEEAGKPVRLHIANDGLLDGLVWDGRLKAEEREAFRKIMLAVGWSDWARLKGACLPTPAAPNPLDASVERAEGPSARRTFNDEVPGVFGDPPEF